jgi:chorismate dehydratase
MSNPPSTIRRALPHVGAVNYLNSKPLIHGLDQFSDRICLLLDLPSRLADSLAQGWIDVALIPSIEFFRNPEYVIVSDACIACRGPVLSVKLFFRVPPEDVRRLALDEGSRTSEALARILLKERFGVAPELEPLPIGATLSDTSADAVLLIGDRAIPESRAPFVEVWDLGDQWYQWTGLPFVFAMWIARAGEDFGTLASLLTEARDAGVRNINIIAEREARLLEIEAGLARRYLSENLHFTLGEPERHGLGHFRMLCARHGLISTGFDTRPNLRPASFSAAHA